MAFTATAADATSVIGFGDSTNDNQCANSGSAHVASAQHTSGGVVSNLLALPFSAPANQCGDLGLPKEDKAEQPAENAHIDIAE
ncbi:hypothetical protein [Streptomyces zagrosensis]|uniref:Chaplin domain-containing protein n=1 Tax=Streptomyces zagrosensis TaxID=1042984 RepID=A0A7W9UZX0_9ACTN|nr:hypothetical protein [Streptomyces zagrosensis]MBB5937217.1 hypothetical protein [Streptomyces zagrosensis]